MNKRPILIITVSYIIGILWGLYLEISIVPFSIISFIILWVLHKQNKIKKYIKIINIIVIVITISSTIIEYKERKYEKITNSISENIKCVGVVISEGKETEYYYNYIVKVHNIHILVRCKKNKNMQYNKLEFGDKIALEGNFEKPSVRRNYKGYDYSQYLKTKGVYGICETDINNVKVLGKNQCFVINMWINMLKNKLKTNTNMLLPNETAGVAIAMFLGDTDFIDENQKHIFSNASLSHILAISGMHVTYVFIGFSWMLKVFDTRKSKYFFLCFLILYAQLTGASPSVVRAVIMCSIMIISKLVYRKSDSLNNIAISSLIILISNPYNILNLGFQLSFVGTLGIVLFNNRLSNKIIKNDLKGGPKHKILRKLCLLLITSISANILILPILIYNFNMFSITFLFSNILISPILGILFLVGYITILISIVSIKLATPFAYILNFLITTINYIASISADIKFTRALVATPSIITIIVYYLLISYLFCFHSKIFHSKIQTNCIYKKCSKVIAISLIFIITLNSLRNHSFGLIMHFIDVGQGDSTLIITELNKKILIDGGGSETGNYDVGEKVLVPYLLDRKVKSIDYMIISHFDSDHCKGLFSVIENLDVKNAIISKQGKNSENYQYFLSLTAKRKTNIICVEAGNRLKIDNFTYIDIIWPYKELIQDNILNNNSIVFKLNYRNSSILFTGDIEEIAEKQILNKYDKNMIKSTILKVAHHGSKTSSTDEFIKSVNPKIALIGVGEKNNFGHPNLNVIQRLNNVGTKVYRTDEMGEISLFIKRNGSIMIKTQIK